MTQSKLIGFPVNHLRPGLYILEIRNGNQVKTLKMLKEDKEPKADVS